MDEIISAAARHPFYEGRIAKERPLSEQPILTKALLREAIGAFGEVARPGLSWSPSGGTGGRPLYVPADRAEYAFGRELLGAKLRDAGVFTGNLVCVNLGACGALYRTMDLYNDLAGPSGATMLSAGNGESNERILEHVDRFHANALVGSPPLLVSFANHLARVGRTLDLQTVISGADTLFPAQRERIREMTGAKTFAEIFGSAECGAWAFRPASLEGSSSFVFDPRMIHAEIVDPDAEGFGRLVVTHLGRRVMPLLRFDTGDIARIGHQNVDGRREETIDFAGRHGRSFSFRTHYFELDDLEAKFPRPDAILKYQVQLGLDEDNESEVARLLVVAPSLSSSERWLASQALRQFLAFRCVDFVEMENLEHVAGSGKVPVIVDHRRDACT